jgi:hypothetical protein
MWREAASQAREDRLDKEKMPRAKGIAYSASI